MRGLMRSALTKVSKDSPCVEADVDDRPLRVDSGSSRAFADRPTKCKPIPICAADGGPKSVTAGIRFAGTKLPFASRGIVTPGAVNVRRLNSRDGIKVKHSPLLLIVGLVLLSHAVRADEPPASTCFHESPISIPKDKLVHLDSPNRVPNALSRWAQV